ncbi:SDR family oxidoreductase [Cohnella pontilimi]|uniref:SDR family oxidoreductase n=1 Tax=Cohnella pontilimi TaxID=2564100 RepID=A0A4U0FD64_9BACL|nr:SDR family oxidoreductase [Cohnella pontilimi]TJY42856.1 SDR family oxidoreductase [Cohnella pontilimi]
MIDFQQLKGKTVAITGASRGIGKETAALLAGLGANLVLGARNTDELHQVATELGANTLALDLDVTSESSVVRFVEASVAKFGRVDALINCAGTGVFEAALELSSEDFDRMITVNLRGTFLTCKYFGQHMLQQEAGRIVNVVSVAGTTALAGCAGYSASKFGVLGLTRVMQAELRHKGIQVSAVLPGAVATPFWDGMTQKPDLSNMIPVQSLARHIVYILCQPEGSSIDEILIMPPLGIL